MRCRPTSVTTSHCRSWPARPPRSSTTSTPTPMRRPTPTRSTRRRPDHRRSDLPDPDHADRRALRQPDDQPHPRPRGLPLRGVRPRSGAGAPAAWTTEGLAEWAAETTRAEPGIPRACSTRYYTTPATPLFHAQLRGGGVLGSRPGHGTRPVAQGRDDPGERHPRASSTRPAARRSISSRAGDRASSTYPRPDPTGRTPVPSRARTRGSPT